MLSMNSNTRKMACPSPKSKHWLALAIRFHVRTGRLPDSRDCSTSQAPKERVDASASDLRPEIPVHSTCEPVCDPQYYFDMDGTSVFRVEDTLFRVHKFLLSRDSSAFGNMFHLPCNSRDATREGSSPDHPIILCGDTVEQFRALLWMLYALPSELQHVSLTQLLSIAEIAHKYHFDSSESWALKTLYTSLRHSPTHQLSSDTYARALGVSLLCDHPRLRDFLLDDAVFRILWQNLHPTPVLLALAEKHGLHKLQGAIYYRLLVAAKPTPPLPGTCTSTGAGIPLTGSTRVPFDASLSPTHRLRLLSGFHSLVSLWARLHDNPPALPPSDTCACHARCRATWANKWVQVGKAEETLAYGPADVLGRLNYLGVRLREELVAEKVIPLQCTLAAFEAMSGVLEGVLANLMDHFVDD